jgi:cytoskeletal protein CcmA (bactofilin family)
MRPPPPEAASGSAASGRGREEEIRMNTKRRFLAALRWLALAPALLALAPAAAQAADLRQGSDVTIPAGVTVADDLYASGGTVHVNGTIAGSLIAAGGTVDVSGTVQHDVLVAGGTVTISGPVTGTVRVTGGNLRLSGPVGEDVVAVGGTIDVAQGTTIGRDLVLGGGTATVAGQVGRDLTAGAGSLDLLGSVERNVKADVTNLHLENGATIGGNLDYGSDNAARIDPGATVTGTVTHSPAQFTHQPTAAQRVVDTFTGWIRLVVGLFVLGLLVLLPFGAFGRRAAGAIGGDPLSSLGLGLAVLIGVPIAALVVFVLGLLVGGWPLALAALAILAIGAAVGYVLAAVFVGQTAFRLVRTEAHPLLELLVGLVVLTAIGLVPVLGGLVDAAAVVMGLGALALTLFRSWRGPATAVPTGRPSPAVQGTALPA